MWHRHSSLERGVGSPAAEDLKHRRYHHYHHYFDHQTFIKCYGKFISFRKTELISDNTPQPGVCCSSLWDELAAIFWSPSRYVDGAKKATDDSTDKLIMNCVLPLCWSLGGNKQRCENESCYQVDSPLKQKKKNPTQLLAFLVTAVMPFPPCALTKRLTLGLRRGADFTTYWVDSSQHPWVKNPPWLKLNNVRVS